MVRTRRFLGAILMVLMLCACFLFCGCKEDAKIEGTYKFSKMTYVEAGVQVEINAGEKFMGMITFSEDYMTLTLNENGTAVMVMSDGESMETGNGTWTKIDNNTLQITIEGEPENVQWSGNTITMENDGATVILKK